MGVFIDYAFHAECSEQELLARLRRLRRKLQRLPFDSVSRVLRVDPAYQSMPLTLMTTHGFALPPAVQRRLRGKLGTNHDDLCFLAASPCDMLLPQDMLERFYQPALDFSRTTTLWRPEDLPDKINAGSITYHRHGFVMNLANVMLRHGYLIVVQPCEGCETFAIGLTGFRTAANPCWLGSGFTKTQYATRFVLAHESICKGLDFARDEGLLHAAGDTCKFFNHRDWSKSAAIVNAETTFAHVVGGLLSMEVSEAQKRGANIEDMSDPATRNYNLIQVREPSKE